MPNTTVTFAVYRLTMESQSPTEGKLVGTFTNKFPLAGYHRVDIPKNIYLHERERFSIVSSAHAPDNYGRDMYWLSSNTCISKSEADALRAKDPELQQYYGVGIINPGESAIYRNDAWTDWKEYVNGDYYKQAVRTSGVGGEADNFSIKAYSVAWKKADKDNHKHVWDGGEASIELSEKNERVVTYTCTECGETKTEKVSNEAAEEIITKAERKVIKTDLGEDPKNSEYAPLMVTTRQVKKNLIRLKWDKVKNAKTYLVYGSTCKKKSKMSKCATVSSAGAKIWEVNGKDLEEGTYYKFIVIALNEKGKVITVSDSVFVATEGGKKENPTDLTVKPKTVKIDVKETQTLTTKVEGKYKKFMGVRYESSNEKVAKVTKKGVVKGLKKGSCKVYVYAQNGIAKTVDVTVTN